MGAKSDEAKGRIKEAAGDLTGNKALKRRGQADRVGAKVKGKIGESIDKAKGVIGGRN
ncbi:MAG: CsbD family protein [Actinomycetota bacterium]|nr:CsbD family protein [Actinomycetota bacterium]